MSMNIWKFAIVLLLFIGVSCEEDDTVVVDENQNIIFDRGAMLQHWADAFIIPAYTDLAEKTAILDESVVAFNANPSIEELDNLRDDWFTAYRSFQKTAMFEIGKAETLNYRNRLNVYPTNASEVEDLIASGSWNFELPSTIDSQGFPALDYVLNGLGTAEETIANFTTNANAANYKNYLKALSETINNLTNEVLNDWNTGFRDIYVANISSSSTGAVDQTVNAFMFYYEKALRAGKVGIPAGVFSSDPLSQNVEALYKSDISRQLLQDALNATRAFFNGTGTVSGPSLKLYLDTLNVVKNGSNLSTLINTQFETTDTQITGLLDNFVIQIAEDNSKMLNTYDELQRNVILMKVDMFQALSIDINFVDSDGD